MQVGGTSLNAVKGSGLRRSKKTVESFIPWRKPLVIEGQGGSSLAKEIADHGTGKEKRTTVGQICRPSNYECKFAREGRQTLPNALPEEPSRQSKMSSETNTAAGEVSDQGRRTVVSTTSKTIGDKSPFRGRENFTGTERRSGTSSATTTRTVPREIYIRNKERRFAVLQGVRREEVEQGSPQSEGRFPAQGRFESDPAVRVSDDEVIVDEEFEDSRSVPDDEEDVEGDDDDEIYDDRVQGLTAQSESEKRGSAFYREYIEDRGFSYHEEPNRGQARHLLGAVGTDDIEDLENQTEAEKKKDRRQERAWLEKEGDRRRKEGLPRNFLLVDEFTKQPYGVGVGDWKKELMLLSRDLDPSIGNINRQPEGAVEEIAEWIQHTWEYSSPIKFEYVKEVVARGVTLRRGKLWKKMRNGEKQPNGFSDRTWQTLERQLENPASIIKSENCRKANASRLNYGRTGPSGEAGVRNKLRRILRRSPHPEEIRMEMAWDKGFGGRQRLKDNDLSVMQGSATERQLSMEVHHVKRKRRNSQEEGTQEYDDDEPTEKRNKVFDLEGRESEKIAGNEERESIISVSTDQICQHPFVAMMMKRLEALETKSIDTIGEGDCQSIEECPPTSDEGGSGSKSDGPHELQDVLVEVCAEEDDVTRKSRRLRKKGKEG